MSEYSFGIAIDVLAWEIDRLRYQSKAECDENTKLRDRVKALEEENAKLRAMIGEGREKHE